MNTEQQTAFIDTPPEGFLKFSLKTKQLIKLAISEAGVSGESVNLYGAYYHISKGNYKPSAKEIMDAYLALDDYQVDELEAYVNRVIDREKKSAITIENSPGK